MRRNAVVTLPGSLNARDPRLHLQPHHEDYVSNSVNSYNGGGDDDEEVGKVELPVRMVASSQDASHAVLVTMRGIQLDMDETKSKGKGFNVASVSFASNTGQLIKGSKME